MLSKSSPAQADIGRTGVFLPALLRVPALIIAGSLVMVVCSRITVPFWPVPMTVQVFGVFLLAALAGGRSAAGMVALYLLYGALGLPVFANAAHGGLAALAGPTGGYLAGFVIAAFVSGAWIRGGGLTGRMASILPMLAGLLIIYGLGGMWLSRFVGWPNVLAAGVLPFLLGDAVKVALAATVTSAILRRARRA
jgi:biotin transport system substrate-specific component